MLTDHFEIYSDCLVSHYIPHTNTEKTFNVIKAPVSRISDAPEKLFNRGTAINTYYSTVQQFLDVQSAGTIHDNDSDQEDESAFRTEANTYSHVEGKCVLRVESVVGKYVRYEWI